MEATSSNCDEGLVSSNSEKVSELTKEVRFLRSKTKQKEQELAKLRENSKNIKDRRNGIPGKVVCLFPIPHLKQGIV